MFVVTAFRSIKIFGNKGKFFIVRGFLLYFFLFILNIFGNFELFGWLTIIVIIKSRLNELMMKGMFESIMNGATFDLIFIFLFLFISLVDVIFLIEFGA